MAYLNNTRSGKILVILILLALFMQLGNRLDEPYPAILLPGGGGIMWNPDQFILYEHHLIAHSTEHHTKQIDKQELFDSIPKAYIDRNISSLLTLAANPNGPDSVAMLQSKLWLKNKLQAVTGFDEISHLEIIGKQKRLFITKGRVDSTETSLFMDSFNIYLN